MTTSSDLNRLRSCAAFLDPNTLAPSTPADAAHIEPLWAQIDRSRIIVLGELDHFIAEKNDFRLWWLRQLAERYPLVLAEEIGHADGQRIARFLASADAHWLDRVPTFGWKGDARGDREDAPSGVLRSSFQLFPTARFKQTQSRFYHALRELGCTRLHGIDVDGATGAGYANIEERLAHLDSAQTRTFLRAMARIPGESVGAEADRITVLRARLETDEFASVPGLEDIAFDLEWTELTLRYALLAYPARDYAALRPAMQLREQMMKRAVDRLLARLAPNEKLVLMAHALHLAKDDDRIGSPPASVGPGGDIEHSLGHYLARERAESVCAIWFMFAEGSDCQPFPDLPQRFDYPEHTLNAQLARVGEALVLPTAAMLRDKLTQPVAVGHMYNVVAQVDLPAQTDAVFFLRRVSPLPDVNAV